MIKRLALNPRVGTSVFALLTLLIFANVGIFEHINDKPNSVHTWAQTDRASVAACYFNENMNFFKPRIYNRSDGNNSGISGMEFPVINYLAAICYKLFGFHEAYYRLINFLLLFMGIVFAFLLANMFLKDFLLSAVTVWLFIMSPVLFFYSANFLPDTGSLGLVLTSWYLFFKIGRDGSRRYLVWFFIVITLACLIKLTSMVSLIAMIIIMTGNRFVSFNSDMIPALNRRMGILLGLSFLIVISWYQYATWLNDTYQNYFFILKGNSVQTFLEFKQVMMHILEAPYPDYYPQLMKNFIAVFSALFIVSFFFQNRLLTAITFLLLAGYSAFALSMLRQFQYHDYYIIPLLPLIFFLILSVTEVVARRLLAFRTAYFLALGGLAVVANMSMIACKKNYRNERYGEGYQRINYSEYDRYVHAAPYLDTLGVGKEDLVISYYDLTPNGSLYLMNRKGTTVRYGDIDRLQFLMATNNFKYLILNDTARFTPALYESLVPKKIGDKYRVQVYKLHD